MAISPSKSATNVEKQKLTKDDELSVSTTDSEREAKRSRGKKRVSVPDKCSLCEAGLNIDYKNVYRLKRFTSRRGRMIPRSRSGLCARHQRQISTAIKRARLMALIPYVAED